MARVTALRALDRGRVAVELDGRPWRAVPAAAVVGAGLVVGDDLTRHAARTIRRELRRAEAAEAAAALLRHRDRSSAELEQRLTRRRVAPSDRRALLESLERAGLVDDAALAVRRAAHLAERGWGDQAIEHRLAAAGLARQLRRHAIDALASEPERARLLLSARGIGGRRAAGLLRRRGFSEEAVEDALGLLDGWHG